MDVEVIFPALISDLAQRVVAENARLGRKIATAESCTGGLVSAALTEVAGSSAVFEYGFATYANAAKSALLGVDPAILESFGAVSIETVRAMAVGAVRVSGADAAVAISGIAGPGGGSSAKPVGTVVFALAQKGQLEKDVTAIRKDFGSDRSRAAIRGAAAAYALELLLPPAA
ncbi:CinA family protein [Sphingorhabdus arenilitoris]|uniref:CinA family protein n=1 Tax=Sphingorhabdus arenilitoris TaxID=1490041 RepID=A0ABV8RID0_9SPHN